MVIRGVFIVTLLPPITTFGIKSAKCRGGEGFLGENQEDIEQKSCFFGLIRGFFYRFWEFYWRKREGNYVLMQ